MSDDQPSERPRVLVPVTIVFAVRYLLRTGLLDGLREACEPVLALSWDDDELADRWRAEGWEVLRLPDPEVGPTAVARFADAEVHFAHRLASPSTAIDRARRLVGRPRPVRLRRWARWQVSSLRARLPGAAARDAAALADAIATDTNRDAMVAWLREHRFDALFSVTPFTTQERVVLLAAEAAGLPACTSILSFDNITTRPPLPIDFDRYLVWNRFNEQEILRSYPGVAPDQVRIVGPAQFDFYADPSLVEDRATWRAGAGVGDGPVVLFGAGPPEVAPHERQYVEHLCAAVDDGRLPADTTILLRRHPVDHPSRWAALAEHPAVVLDEPGRVGTTPGRLGQIDLGRAEIAHLCTVLANTDVHVSTSSTMSLDGAFYDKPQVAPAYDVAPGHPHRRLARDLYRREHFLPIVASGGIALARSPEELVAQVRDGIDHPEHGRAERRRMLEALCTHLDGGSTERAILEVLDFLRVEVRRA